MSRRKRSRDATADEIFPDRIAGRRNHGPVQPAAAVAMRQIMDAITKLAPGFDVALFLIEKPEAVTGRDPRFNYAATVDRADMLAVLKAFIAKNEANAPVLDRITETPPTENRQ